MGRPRGFRRPRRSHSTLAPVVDTQMSDDAAIHFYLYRHGRLEDQFGNAAFPFYRYSGEEEAAPLRGKPGVVGGPSNGPQPGASPAGGLGSRLAGAGDSGPPRGCWMWEPETLWVGYTYDNEGIPIKYDEFLQDSGLDMGGFEEFHFASVGKAAGPIAAP